MKIKTVYRKIYEDGTFDQEVNELLADGWRLAKREFVSGLNSGDAFSVPFLYAELVKLDEADMEDQEPDPVNWQEAVEALRITWQEAVWVLRETCQEAKECGPACPMFAWCQKNLAEHNPPASWDDPEELDPAE